MAQDQPPPLQPDPPKDSPAESQAGLKPEQPESRPILPSALDSPQGLRPTFRSVALRLLRGTVQVLEQAIARLEANSPPPAEPAPPAASVAKNFRLQASREALIKILRPGLSRLQALGLSLRDRIRSRLPATLNQKLSDPALAGAIAGIFVLSLWTLSALLPSSKPTPSSVSIAPPLPTATPVAAPTAQPTSVPVPEQPTPALPAPINPASPVATPQPTPSLALNPQPTLIASIQTQVAEITNQYADGLIQSVEANFQGSRLTLRVRDGWYSLAVAQQDQLVAETLQRSQDLDFRTLYIVDEANQLVARSPVVGTRMVILKRHFAPLG